MQRIGVSAGPMPGTEPLNSAYCSLIDVPQILLLINIRIPGSTIHCKVKFTKRFKCFYFSCRLLTLRFRISGRDGEK